MRKAGVVLFAIVVCFYWKLVLTNQYTWLEGPDLANLVLPWFQFQAGEWHHGRFPLWDPNSWYGQPLFGQAQPGSAYPLNWLLFLAPLKQGWIRESALHWYTVLMHFLAALTACAFARDLGRSRTASILAGCVYALGGYVAVTTAPQMVNGAVWTPLVFLFLFRAERGERPLASSLLSGFFLGVGWLAGHHQMNLFVTLTAATLWIWFCVRKGKLNRQLAVLAGCSMGMAVLASGFQTIPTAEFGPRAVRWTGLPSPQQLNETVPYSVHQEYALKPVSVLGVFIPGVEYKNSPYIGIVAFGLALMGVILGWREKQARWLAALCVAGILLSLGANSIFHGVLYALVPMVDKARVPAAFTLVFAAGVAPLAAYGVDLLPRPENISWLRRFRWWLAGFALVIAAISVALFEAKITPADDRLMIPAIAAILAAGLLVIPSRAVGIGLIGLVLFELANVTGAQFPSRSDPAQNPYLKRLSEHSDLVDFIRNRGVAARIEYDDNEIPYNIGDWYGIEVFNAYTASSPSNIWDMGVFSPRSRDFFGVNYYLGKNPQRPDSQELFAGRSGVKVFLNPNAYPRVWSVHRAVSLPDRKAVDARFEDAGFNLRQTVLLAGKSPELGGCGSGGDEVQMPLHAPNYVRITATLACRGMVILTDTWYPGWRATVDGHAAEIYEAYGGVRGVVAEAGPHVIEMRYRPWSVAIGALMTLAAAGIALRAAIMRTHAA